MSALEVTELQRATVDRLAGWVVRLGMTVPAILAIETVRPLSFVGSQLMVMLSPSIRALFTAPEWDALAALLEDRRGIDYLLDRIEALDRMAPSGQRPRDA